MNGLELSRRYFFEAALPLVQERFPELSQRVAAGLVSAGLGHGAGSEVGGFDDEISRDHNWGPRCFLFISEQDKTRLGEALQACLDQHLPEQFHGFRTIPTTLPAHRVSVLTPQEHLRAVLDLAAIPTLDLDWLGLPEALLFEYTAGEIYYEPVPLVSPLREQLVYYPEEVWHKRLSFAFFCLHAVGNAHRMALRGDLVATRFYIDWLLEGVMRACFLLRRRYAPYRKWLFRAFQELPDLPEGLREGVEGLARTIDLDTVREAALQILDHVGTMANESGLIEPQPLRKKSPYIWTDFNCYGFMQAFEDKLRGPLQGYPHEGPIDLWASTHMVLTPAVARAAIHKVG
jgi:uncharacterized protein DUF4037